MQKERQMKKKTKKKKTKKKKKMKKRVRCLKSEWIKFHLHHIMHVISRTYDKIPDLIIYYNCNDERLVNVKRPYNANDMIKPSAKERKKIPTIHKT